MKVPLHVVKARRAQLAELLQRNRFLSLSDLCEELDVSEATARRDLAVLAREKVITRTWGGALVDFNQRFPSFQERQFRAQAGKRQMAARAIRELRSGMTVFFDAGTTVYAITDALAKRPIGPLSAVTNSLPAAEKLAEIPGVDAYIVAGKYLARQSVLFGEPALRSLRLWKFDVAFTSAEGMTAAGIWNSQKDIVQFQREVVKLASRTIFCIDETKLGQEAPQFLVSWTEATCLLTDATGETLKAAGIKLRRNNCLCAA